MCILVGAGKYVLATISIGDCGSSTRFGPNILIFKVRINIQVLRLELRSNLEKLRFLGEDSGPKIDNKGLEGL